MLGRFSLVTFLLFATAGKTGGKAGGGNKKQAHPLFPRLEQLTGGRLPVWRPTLNDTKRCDDHQKPKYCMHFTRRSWCVKQVEQGESTFGKTWIFNEREGRDGRDDFHFCQQYRFYDLVQKRKRLERKRRKLAAANAQMAQAGAAFEPRAGKRRGAG